MEKAEARDLTKSINLLTQALSKHTQEMQTLGRKLETLCQMLDKVGDKISTTNQLIQNK